MQLTNVTKIMQLLLLGGVAAARMSAIGGCGNAYLQGFYGAQMSGVVTDRLGSGVGGDTRVGASSLAGPATASATYSFDGAGNVIGDAAANVGGMLLRNPLAGTYSVNDDCTLSISLTDSAGGVQSFEGVATAGGDKILLIQTDAGAGVSGVLQRSRSSCSVSDLSGSYGYRREGSTPFFTSVGVLNADGSGGFTMSQLLYSNGTFSRSSTFGTYEVGADCSVALTLNQPMAGDSTSTMRGQLVDGGKRMMSIRTDPGFAVRGDFTAQ